MANVFVIGPVYPWRGGIAHSNNLTCENLSKKNNVTVISFSKLFPDFLYPGESQKEDSPLDKKFPFRAEHVLDPVNPMSWIAVAWRIKKEMPDVVIFQWWHTFFFPCYASIILLGRNGHTKFGAITQNVLPHEDNPINTLLTKSFFGMVDYLVTYASTDLESVKRIAPDKKAHFIVEPTTETNFGAVIPRKKAKKELGVKGPAMLFFGFIRPYKGLKWLLRAMPMVIPEYPEIKLLVVGEFWNDKQEYLDEIEKLGIGKNIVLVSRYVPNEEVPKYFSAVDCIVMPYESSTQSGIIQLAYGLNTPIITTAVGGNPDLVEHMKTGILVEPKSEKRIAEAIITFYRKKLAQKFRRAMRKKAGIFSWTDKKEKIMLAGNGEPTRGKAAGNVKKSIVGGNIEVQKNDSNFKARNEAMMAAGLIEYEGQPVNVSLLEEEYDGKIWVGMAGIIKRHGFIPSLFVCVNEKYRKMGWGTKLVGRVMEKKNGPVFLTIDSLDPTPEGIAGEKIYRRNGFFTIIPYWKKFRGVRTKIMLHL